MRTKTKDQRLKTEDLKQGTPRVLVYALFFGLWAFAFSLQSFAASSTAMRFKEAADLYKVGKYDEAARIYESLIAGSSTAERAVLYFNLANTRYRTGKVSEAIWNYERALFINPWYSDASYNLNSVKSKLEYKIEDRRNFFIRFNDFVLKWVKMSELAAAALVLSLLFLVSSFFWLRGSKENFFWAFPRLECFALFLIFAVLWTAKGYYLQNYSEATVLVTEAEVRYGPSADNQSLMKLGGGLKVYVVDSREDWSRVLTWNGETGWMRNSDLGRIDS